jgi:hypothetical protein
MTVSKELAAAQRRLVEALVTGGPVPPGFDTVRVAAAARALLRKRAGEVARTWPRLASSYGTEWRAVFTEWAANRPTRGSWRDGWDFARAERDSLTAAAATELAVCEACWSYDGTSEPRRRPFAARRIPGGFAVQAFGRLTLLTRNGAMV